MYYILGKINMKIFKKHLHIFFHFKKKYFNFFFLMHENLIHEVLYLRGKIKIHFLIKNNLIV